MSTWILHRNILLSLLAAEILSACLPVNEPAGIPDTAAATVLPQTPKTNQEGSPGCRLHEELPLEDVTSLSLPELDVQTLLAQDQNLPKDAPLRYAVPVEVHVDPAADGTWAATDAVQVWRLKIVSRGALSLSLGFTAFHLPAQACLFVFSPGHRQILGPYMQADNAEHGQLWTPIIEGEEVVIELSLPREKVSQLQLVLGIVNQGYKE